MTKIQKEVMESAQLTDAQQEVVNGVNDEQPSEVSMVLQYLAPWIEKNDDEESVGSWETTLATKMMVKLLELWLTQESREKVAKMLEYYHPLDRAAMAYALVVYVMTGTKMTFKSAMATQHFKTTCKMLKEDMPTLMFANHMKYMIRKYGPKRSKK
jgi:L-lactate permease